MTSFKSKKVLARNRKQLTKEDKKSLAKLRILPKLIEQAGLFRVDTNGAVAEGFVHSGDLSGIVFPYCGPDGKPFNLRLRRDNPEIGADGKEEDKYLSLESGEGIRRGLFWSPGAYELSKRPGVEYILVEAEKSGLAGMSYARRAGRNLVFLATSGCWGWRDKEEVVVSDLHGLAGRKVGIMFDANVATSPKVQQAESALAAYLTNLQCAVSCFRLPQTNGINGPDDFLKTKSDADFLAVLKNPVEPWLDRVGESYEAYMNAPEPTFLIKDFLQTGGATFVGGLPGDGKTYVLLSMVQSLLKGKKLFGYFPVENKPRRCVYLTPEITLGSFRKRAAKFGLDEFVKNRQLIVRTLTAYPEITLDDPAVMLTARDAVIFLDPAVRFMGGDEQSNSDFDQGLARTIFQLVHAGALCVVAAHHSPKDFENAKFMTLQNCLRGAGAIGGMLTSAWGIYQLDRATRANTICYMANLKPRDFEPPPGFQIIGKPHIDEGRGFQMHVHPEHCGSLQESQKEFADPSSNRRGPKPSSEKQERAEAIRGWLRSGKDSGEIKQLLKDAGFNLSDGTVAKEISEAKKVKYA